jgi:hypothetical protein
VHPVLPDGFEVGLYRRPHTYLTKWSANRTSIIDTLLRSSRGFQGWPKYDLRLRKTRGPAVCALSHPGFVVIALLPMTVTFDPQLTDQHSLGITAF